MEKLIQLLQSLHGEWSALAWVLLGLLLPFFILLGLTALFWIRRGGMASGNSFHYFATQWEISDYLAQNDKERPMDAPRFPGK